MSTLTASATLSIGAGAIASESTTATVIAAPGAGSGMGRLVHPSLGTIDYDRPPDEWANMDGSAVIAPIWSSTKTLLGASNTLFPADLRDVVCEERWTQSIAASIDHLRALLSVWMNPPDPAVGYVQWFPNYVSARGYNVVVLALSAGPGGRDIVMTPLYKQGWQRGPIVLRMRIVSEVIA